MIYKGNQGITEDDISATFPFLPIHPSVSQEAIYQGRLRSDKLTSGYKTPNTIPARNLDYLSPSQLFATTGPSGLDAKPTALTINFNKDDGVIEGRIN